MPADAAAQWIAPSKLKPWPNNPRVIDAAAVARVAEVIKQLGFGAPIVARKKTLEIIAGHTRWLAAQELKLKRVPVRLLDLSEKDAHLLALADNRLSELGQWSASLADYLAQLKPEERTLAGWSERDFEKMHAALTPKGLEGNDETTELDSKTCPSCGRKFQP